MVKQIEEVAKSLEKILSDEKKLTHGIKRGIRKFLSEYKMYESHIKSIQKASKTKMKKIQIGGGSHILEGFLNVDIFPPADLIFDVREGLPLISNTAEFIFSEHFLEHIDYPVSALKVISESYRVLKKDGVLIVGVPDAELIISKYHDRDKIFFKAMLEKWYSKRTENFEVSVYSDLLNYNLRDQDDSKQYTPHLWGYDYEKLESMCKKAGFREVQKWEPDLDLVNSKRIWGSIYIKATK